jgi:hypothetical protein
MNQMPGSPMYNLALYYMLKTPLEDNLLLHSFVEGDDTYRNSRFKLIPYISKVNHMSKISKVYDKYIFITELQDRV